MLTVNRNVKAASLYTIEKSIAAGIFYSVAKSRVKDIEALKWICLASITQALLSPICKWAIAKQPLHFGKVKSFFEAKKLTYLLSMVELLFLRALSLSPTLVVGIIKKDLKTAFIAFIILDVLNRGFAEKILKIPSISPSDIDNKYGTELTKEVKFLYEVMDKGTTESSKESQAIINSIDEDSQSSDTTWYIRIKDGLFKKILISIDWIQQKNRDWLKEKLQTNKLIS